MPDFDDIRIIDLDEDKTHNPDKSRLLYNIYLKLSAYPPPVWEEIFDAERRFPRHSMWRRAWVEGSHIVIHAPLDELESHHLEDLKTDVKNTNAKYRECLIREATLEAKKQATKETEDSKITNLKKKLNFDDNGAT